MDITNTNEPEHKRKRLLELQEEERLARAKRKKEEEEFLLNGGIDSAASDTDEGYKSLFMRFKMKAVLINLFKPDQPTTAKILNATRDYVTLLTPKGKFHVSYSQIITVAEAGVGAKFAGSADLNIYIMQLVIYKGAMGFGVSVPISGL